MVTPGGGPLMVRERYAVGGMTCAGCAEQVESALRAVPGVQAVSIDQHTASALVARRPHLAPRAELERTVSALGYRLQPPRRRLPVRPPAYGALGAAGLLAFYLGIISIAQGWTHAVEQLSADRWFAGPIMVGFGTQIGLFGYLRQLHARARAGGVAVSTGTSTAAMLACCAHHVADILPVIGLSGAALFLNEYKTPLLWLGMTMNALGVAYLLWRVIQQRRLGAPDSPSTPPATACHTSTEGA